MTQSEKDLVDYQVETFSNWPTDMIERLHSLLGVELIERDLNTKINFVPKTPGSFEL